MLDLSPTKLLIIFVVVIVLLGPKRLPQVARQLGAGWRKIRALSQQVESELRQTMPDLPSGRDIARFARSPITLLNQLAETPPGSTEDLVEDPSAPLDQTAHPAAAEPAPDAHWPEDPASAETVGTGETVVPDGPFGTTPRATSRTAPRAGATSPTPGALADHGDLAQLAVDDPTLN